MYFGIREYDKVRGQNTAKDLITACDQENYANFLKNKGLCLQPLRAEPYCQLVKKVRI